MVQELNYQDVEFPVRLQQRLQQNYNKIEVQNDININAFGYENK